jgi:type II secretory pathway pseudopilin PulG
VELLAVIGIIVLLVGILVPTVMSARRAADKNAARMELQTIAMALDAYRADFGDYPRPPSTETRYRLLAWALIGPYGETATAARDPWNGVALLDGADGPGFRTVKGSKVWGPYLPPDKFQLVSGPTLDPRNLQWDILSRYGSPIEYFPRWRNYGPGKNMNLFGTNGNPKPPTPEFSVYDYRQQWQANPAATPRVQAPVVTYLRRVLGDDYIAKNPAADNPGGPPNDRIDGSETAREMPPFILVTPGPTRTYPDDKEMSFRLDKCDVITNLQH